MQQTRAIARSDERARWDSLTFRGLSLDERKVIPTGHARASRIGSNRLLGETFYEQLDACN